ncbi:hypothetical protein DAPPUDRAFT_344700 [Daphnia pulex]|uniref:Uncharacterized protein n=1 Tax=Daphnia pulex TaxID=6669 RepID=E9I718_DAPPU|nr:hypothetical protein DAPPUDRAFT_344700 [Daphnia pulex]|eukprot:EFX60211.1 hypothetical protein DAPPUDRAFT_344700 [Daphnia pulex]
MPPPPDTELKRELIEKSLPIDIQFLRDVATHAEGTESLGIEDGSYATTMGLLERFYEWLALTKIRCDTMNSKRLGTTLVKVFGARQKVPRGRVSVAHSGGINEDRPSVYKISFESIMTYKG